MSSKLAVKNGLNRVYAERVSRIPKMTLMVFAHDDIGLLKQALKEWEKQGTIKILLDISLADDDQECVELLSFIS